MKSVLVFLIISLCSPSAIGQSLAEKDYAEKLKRLNKRYEGFFLHQRDQSRFQVKRKSGIQNLKTARKAYASKREKARKGFVRKPPKNMEPLRLKWEAKQDKLKAKRKVSRKKFAKQRAKLDSIEKSAKQIPAMEELGIE